MSSVSAATLLNSRPLRAYLKPFVRCRFAGERQAVEAAKIGSRSRPLKTLPDVSNNVLFFYYLLSNLIYLILLTTVIIRTGMPTSA